LLIGGIAFMGLTMKTALALTLHLFFLTSCAERRSAYPSLAERPIEKLGTDITKEPEAPAMVAPASDPAALDRIAALSTRARATSGPFKQILATNSPIVRRAAGTGRGSDAWVAAQVAMGRLESARAPIKAVLFDLDEQRRLIMFGPPSADEAAVAQAVAEAEAIDADQARDVTELLQIIGGR
jgi:hypothetical protein